MPTYTNATGTTQVVTASSGAEPLPQSGGSYILTDAGELVRADEAPQPAPFPETLTENEADDA